MYGLHVLGTAELFGFIMLVLMLAMLGFVIWVVWLIRHPDRG